MKVYKYPTGSEWPGILSRPQYDYDNLEILVNHIFDEIKQTGDEAVRKYSLEFDNFCLIDLKSQMKNFI